MDDKNLMVLLRRWWPVLLAGAVIGGLAGFAAAKSATPTYAANASLLVGPINADSSTLASSGQLSRTYAELATSRPVLQYAIKASGAKGATPKSLADANDVVATSNDVTRIVSIAVQYSDPNVAARLANSVAGRLKALAQQPTQQSQTTINNLLTQPAISNLPRSSQDSVASAARNVLGASTAGQAEIVDPAEAQPSPVSPKVPLITVLAAIMGMIAAAVIVLLRESSRRNIADERSLASLGTPAFLGSVSAPIGRGGEAQPGLLIEHGSPSILEDYLTLGTKLGFLDDGPTVRTLLLVDAADAAQSGVVAANLAAVLADADRRVLLVDADTLTGTATTVLGLNGRPGYAETLSASRSVSHDGVEHVDVLHSGGMDVLPRGVTAAPGTLDEERARRLLALLRSDVDIVIVCSAPAQRSPAALVWARVTDGSLLVVRAGETSNEQVEESVGSLRFVGANVVGTVLGRRGRLRERARERRAPAASTSSALGAGAPAASHDH